MSICKGLFLASPEQNRASAQRLTIAGLQGLNIMKSFINLKKQAANYNLGIWSCALSSISYRPFV